MGISKHDRYLHAILVYILPKTMVTEKTIARDQLAVPENMTIEHGLFLVSLTN